MTVTEEYLANNVEYAKTFTGPLPMPPSKHVAGGGVHGRAAGRVSVLGLKDGEAHVIRNAGGVVTDDEIRSLAISQRLLGTREIILIHHTDCGMLDVHRRRIQEGPAGRDRHQAGVGGRVVPGYWRKTYASRCAVSSSARSSQARVAARGFVFDVATGKLNEVSLRDDRERHRSLDSKIVAALDRIGDGLHVLARRAAEVNDLSSTQLRVLDWLPWGPAAARSTALARELNVADPTISDAIGALIRKGTRRAPPRPGRWPQPPVDVDRAEGRHTAAGSIAGLRPPRSPPRNSVDERPAAR